MQLSAGSPIAPRKTESARLTQFHLFPAQFACLALCFLSALVLAPTYSNFFHVKPTHAALLGASNGGASSAMSPDTKGTIKGKVTYEGTPKKYRPIDMSAEPTCAKLYASPPMPEATVTGPQNSLQNVIVYISQGGPEESAPNQSPILQITQQGCRYQPHVLSVQTGQEVWVKNSDIVVHSVHPLAHANPEWNRSQPPGTPPVVIRFDQPEFIRVRCELHPWMRGVLAVFKNSHHAVTDNAGSFSLPNLPPGRYTVTTWHEVYGSQSKQITVASGGNQDLDFVYHVTPY